MEKKEKAELSPPVAFLRSAMKNAPLFDPREDDYAAFVRQVSSQASA
ncbi:hypothetical protein [Ochrobactrum sp. Marseille-Q0166]|nr:hypothetical protein [Ochrobactrum sp. Marseille-Q0166]MBC8718834.1 hypothetical protein [Ochrobactrum sp. Marseille-Q0166]